MTTNENKQGLGRYIAWAGFPLALLVLLVLCLMPTPSGLTIWGQRALAVFIFALILWLTTPVPAWLTSLLAIAILPIVGGYSVTSTFQQLGQDVIWLMVCAFILSSGMEKTGIGKRLAYGLLLVFGGSPSLILLGLLFINLALAFVIPSTTARASILLPIALLVAEAFNLKRGESNYGKVLMMQQPMANNLSTSMILTATAPQILAWSFIKSMAGVEIPWLSWLVAQMPIILAMLIILWIVGLKIFPPEVPYKAAELRSKVREELKTMGPLSLQEKITLVIFLMVILLWATDQWHTQMFAGLSIPYALAAVIGAALMFLPKIGPLKSWSDAKIPWDLMIFSAGAYAVGLALNDSGGGQWLVGSAVSWMGLSKGMNPYIVYALLLGLMLYSHIFFSSKTTRTAIFIPLYIALAKSLEISPVVVALPAAFVISWDVTFPYNCKPNLIYFGTGYFDMKDMVKYGLTICTIGFILYLVIGWSWFNFLASIGMLPGWKI